MSAIIPNVSQPSLDLRQQIIQEIHKNKGFIPFSRFMEMALFTPKLGYYNAPGPKMGQSGDFITAPEISPLFAECLARQCQEAFEAADNQLLEIGAGSGRLACDLLMALERLNALPRCYYILEISPALQEAQRALLAEQCPHLLAQCHWISQVPEEFCGTIIANEVLDVLPFDCFAVKDNQFLERGVTLQDENFVWYNGTSRQDFLIQLQERFSEFSFPCHYISEVNFQLLPWIGELAMRLKSGVILFLDYGYGRNEYYHPDRYMGTLQCFYQHRLHDDPFQFVGLQDITAHVDFTAVAEAAIDNGLSLLGYTTQAGFLLSAGLLQIAEEKLLNSVDYYRQNQAIKRLTMPSEMGEIVKVMGLAKNCGPCLSGFRLIDRRKDL